MGDAAAVNDAQLRDKIKKMICDSLGVSEEAIEDSTNIEEDLGADSLDAVELVLDIENEFGIGIPEEDESRLKTFGGIIQYLKEKKGL